MKGKVRREIHGRSHWTLFLHENIKECQTMRSWDNTIQIKNTALEVRYVNLLFLFTFLAPRKTGVQDH